MRAALICDVNRRRRLTPSLRAKLGSIRLSLTTPMRVVFDCQIFCAQEFGGISLYFARLAGEMLEAGTVQPQILVPPHINRYLDRLPKAVGAGTSGRDGWLTAWLDWKSATTGALFRIIYASLLVYFGISVLGSGVASFTTLAVTHTLVLWLVYDALKKTARRPVRAPIQREQTLQTGL